MNPPLPYRHRTVPLRTVVRETNPRRRGVESVKAGKKRSFGHGRCLLQCMENIRTGAISNSFGWTQDTPWYCDKCGEVIVETKRPPCPQWRTHRTEAERTSLTHVIKRALAQLDDGLAEETSLKKFYPTSVCDRVLHHLFWVEG